MTMSKKIIAALLILALTLGCLPAMAENTKHERVYVVADADGEIVSLTDNIRLENADGLDELSDVTMLDNIENVGGGQTFRREGDSLIWQAQGKDIIYQGTSGQAPALLPVVKITLDGEEITASELKNKAGEAELTVTFQTNRPLPVLSVTVLPLPEEGVSDISTVNAAVLTETGQRVLVGWAVPGADAELQLPASFTASFHADHADLSWMMTLMTADPVNLACKELDARIDLDIQAELDEAAALLTALRDGKTLPRTKGLTKEAVSKINQLNMGLNLVDNGAKSLADGTAKLADSAGTLKDGASQVNTGAESLADAMAQLSTGASQVSDGAAGLREGTESLASGMAEAVDGARKLQTGLNALNANSEALNAGAEALLAASLNSANEQLAAAGMGEIVLTAENYEAALNQAAEQAAQSDNEAVRAAAESLTALKAQLDQVSQFVSGLRAYTEGVSQALEGAGQLSTGMDALNGGAASLNAGAQALDEGAKAVKDGLDQALQGAGELKEGAAALADGASQLYSGAVSAKTGAATLRATGTKTLKNSLLDAEKQIAEKLLPYVETDLPHILTLYSQVKEQVRDCGYDLRPEGMNAVTVYIVRTDLQ